MVGIYHVQEVGLSVLLSNMHLGFMGVDYQTALQGLQFV